MKTRIAVLAALASLVAPAAAHAQGVTNPANNPYPVEVTIDGQTFTDGRDTLPGYDDVACTPIPGVQYDFAEGLVKYYDGDGKLLKTAKWSEWSRISSYQDWVNDQKAPTPTATPVRTATPAPTTQTQQQQTTTTTTTSTPTQPAAQNPAAQNPASNTPSSTTKRPTTTTTKNQSSSKGSSSTTKTPSTTKSSSPSTTSTSSPSSTPGSTATSTPSSSSSSTSGPAASSGATSGATDPTVPATDEGAPAPTVDGATDLAATTAGGEPVVAPDGTVTEQSPGGAQVLAAAGPGVASNLELASQTADLAFGDSPTRLAGVGILVGLVALGFFTLAFGEIRKQLFGRR